MTTAGFIDAYADFGVRGDTATDDTPAWNACITAANAALMPITCRPLPGASMIRTGGLPILRVGLYAPEVIFRAIDTTLGSLFYVNYNNFRLGMGGDSAAWRFDVGGLYGVGDANAGSGVTAYGGQGSYFRIRKAGGLWAAFYVDLVHNPDHRDAYGNDVPDQPFCCNKIEMQANACNYGVYINTSNYVGGEGTNKPAFPVDSNYFNLGNSFNHKYALVKIDAGTTPGHSDVFCNTFISNLTEIPQPNSCGFDFQGIANGNTIISRARRGRNGSGVYARTGPSAGGNNWQFSPNWVAGDTDFGSTTQHWWA